MEHRQVINGIFVRMRTGIPWGPSDCMPRASAVPPLARTCWRTYCSGFTLAQQYALHQAAAGSERWQPGRS